MTRRQPQKAQMSSDTHLCFFLARLSLNRPPNPLNNNAAVVGSGTESGTDCGVPSNTTLSIRLVPVDDVAPLNMIRNTALGLLFNASMLDRLNTSGTVPNAVNGVYGGPKSRKLIPSRLYWN